MDSFDEFLSECLDVEVVGEPDALDLSIPSNRDQLNFAILDITDASQDTLSVYDQIANVLDDAGYQIPEVNEFPELLDADCEITIGLNDCALYFAFSDHEIFAEIVTHEELEEIVDEDDNAV